MSGWKIFAILVTVFALILVVIGVVDNRSSNIEATPIPSQPPEVENPTNSEITDILWKWQQTAINDDSTTTPDNPDNYTLELMPDGKAAIKADCNNASSSYEIEGSNISFGPIASTRAYCGDESLDTQYLKDLEATIIYFTEEGKLFFDLQYDSGTMKFSQ